MRSSFVSLIALMLALSVGPAAQAARLIAVLPLDTHLTKGKMDEAARVSLEETLRNEVARALNGRGWTLLTGETMLQVLQDNGVDAAACGDESCHLGLAREIKVETFLSGAVQYVDGEFTASVRLIETTTGRIMTSERVTSKTTTGLETAFAKVAPAFFKRSGVLDSDAPPSAPQVTKAPVTAAVGGLTIATRPAANVRLDIIDPFGKAMSVNAPYENPRAPIGRWKVTATSPGRETLVNEFGVQVDDSTLIKLELNELGSLSVAGTPEGAVVTVTGPGAFRNEGGLPWSASGLRNGAYLIHVARPGYTSHDYTAEVTQGAATKVTATLEKTLTSEVERDSATGLEMVRITGGTFHFGCEPHDKECDPLEQPGKDVTVADFWIGRHEVTLEQYLKCVAAGTCQRPGSGLACTGDGKKLGKHPVNCVSWKDAQSFCQWARGRLPTAEEWEYAAKGGTSRIYPWGDERPQAHHANLCGASCQAKHAEFGALPNHNDGFAETAPVGSFPKGASRHGVLDLIGNVREWTASDYDSANKEVRGCGWNCSALPDVRASTRDGREPDYREGRIGFRCARTP